MTAWLLRAKSRCILVRSEDCVDGTRFCMSSLACEWMTTYSQLVQLMKV